LYPFKKNQQLDYITVSDKEEYFAYSKDCSETFKKLNVHFSFSISKKNNYLFLKSSLKNFGRILLSK